jgi:hypothetical protein
VTLPTSRVERPEPQPTLDEPTSSAAIESKADEQVVSIESVTTIEAPAEPVSTLAETSLDSALRTDELEVEDLSDPIESELQTAPNLVETAPEEEDLIEATALVLEPSKPRFDSPSGEPIWTAEPVVAEAEVAWPAEVAPVDLPAARSQPRPMAATPRMPQSEVVPSVSEVEVGTSRTEWPSAKAIFAAQGRRPQPLPENPRPSRRRATQPQPTDSLAPSQWTLPLWLGWLPVVVLVVVTGSAGLALAYEWAVESNSANLAIQLALRPEGSPGSRIDMAAIPRGGWWTSNATHLSAWAVALARASDGEDHSEEIRSLVSAARHSSQLSAQSRFVVQPEESAAKPGDSSDFSYLGRTRDVVTLMTTGRRLRKAGKLDASLRAYRSAMEIAARANRDNLEPPAFSEDSQIRRYPLPHEAMIGLVVRDMTSAGDWTQEQWLGALPPTATASLVVARVLAGSRQRDDADRFADLAIQQGASPPPAGYDPAEHRAAGAEALAYRRRWTDAAEQYRLAIDQVEDDLTRRMWWLNLADLAQQLNDDSGRARAIEAAKTSEAGDEVTRRALKYQQSLPGMASSGGGR